MESTAGVVALLRECVALVQDLRVAWTGEVEQALERVASNCSHFLSAHGGRFACMRALEHRLPVSRVDVGKVAACFGDVKKFAHIDLLVNIIAHGVPVEVGGVGDLEAALQYGNHSWISHTRIPLILR